MYAHMAEEESCENELYTYLAYKIRYWHKYVVQKYTVGAKGGCPDHDRRKNCSAGAAFALPSDRHWRELFSGFELSRHEPSVHLFLCASQSPVAAYPAGGTRGHGRKDRRGK